MRIKKYNNKNEYLLTSQKMWVRNFTKLAPYIDINNICEPEDHFVFLQNETRNNQERYPWVDTENFVHEKIVIVSDGLNFKKVHKCLGLLPKDITIMAVNGALTKWDASRSPNYYIVNNPYDECMRYLPKRLFPKCIASNRTNADFLSAYRGAKYRYCPVNDDTYNGYNTRVADYQIDDYRNPICAAIGLAYRFGVEKLLLLCCDDSFQDERDGSVQLHNGCWMYPTQNIAHSLIDGNLFWLKKKHVDIRDCSNGPLFENAPYISEESTGRYFSGD